MMATRAALALSFSWVVLFAFASDAASAATAKAAHAGVLTPQTGHTDDITSLVFMSNGKYLVSGGTDRAIRIWDFRSGRLIRMIASSSPVDALSAAPDDRLIFAAAFNIHAWSPATGQSVRSISTGRSSALTSVLSNDGKLIASGSWNGVIKIFDAATGRKKATLRGHTKQVNSIAFTPDDRFLVSGSNDKLIRLWDVAAAKEVRSFKGHTGQVRSVAVSPDGKSVVSGGWNKVAHVWDLDNGRLIRSLKGHSHAVEEVTFSPDGSRIASAGYDGTARIWDAITGKQIRKIKKHPGFIFALAYSPDGKQLVTGTGANDDTLRSWDVETGELVRTFGGQATIVRALAHSPDGRHLAIASADKKLRLWNTEMGRLIRRYDGHTQEVRSVAFSPDGSRIVSTQPQGPRSITIWDRDSGKALVTKYGPIGAVQSVAFSPDGRTLLTAGYGSAVALWDANKFKLVHKFEGAERLVQSGAYSPLGTHVASAESRGPVRIWDVGSGELAHSLKGHRSGAAAVIFSPDGQQLASTGNDFAVKIWDVKTGKLVRSIEGNGLSYGMSLAYSPDGSQIATGYVNSAVVLWDAASGKRIHTFTGHSGAVNSVSFSPSGNRIVTGSSDGTVKFWDVKTGALLATAIATARDWLVVTPEGFFAASENGAKQLVVASGFETFSIDQFYQELYRPDLVREKLAGDPDGTVRTAAAKVNLDKVLSGGASPSIEIRSPLSGTTANGDSITVQAKVVDRGGGMGRVEWRVNGITLGVRERGFERISDAGSVSARVVKQTLRLARGENVISVVAYNSANQIVSQPATVSVLRRPAVESRKDSPRLHVLAVGVNDYYDSRLRLAYAVPDAKALGVALSKAGKGLYSSVTVTNLLDKKVSDRGLDSTFKTLAKRVRPNDVFVFFLAGHGKTVDGKYYFIPQNFRYRSAQSIVEHGIGQERWQSWFAKIPARKSVLIYDTCESGSLTGQRVAMRGMERVAALDKLTRAMGRTVLSAATDDAPALEGYRGHGVFTYALLQALARSDGNNNKLIEVTELASYVDAQVPEISSKAFGLRQVPQMNIVGSNFPLVKQTRAVEPSGKPTKPVSTKPTHVVIKRSPVLKKPGARAPIRTLAPGTQLTLVKTERGWGVVARKGKTLGYMKASDLAPLQ